MALNQRKYEHKHESILRDIRPLSVRIADGLSQPNNSTIIFVLAAASLWLNEWMLTFGDLILFFMFLYFLWLTTRDKGLAFKLPFGAKRLDPNNGRNGKKGKAEGILYLGNMEKTNEQVWFTNSDIRTHILYLGTTGAGKTEGLKSLVTNAMCWGSGFVYVDGKADTDLWSSLSSLLRRFGRDDDLFVLNYMTGNSNIQAPSNTMNPFSSGSASYLTNMLVSLMPDGGGDNAMWKERAVSLVGAMMPVLTWKRDHQEIPMSVRTIRDYLSLNNVIKLSRDPVVPDEVKTGLKGYLDTLPGFIGEAYDDEGKVKPPGPDTPQYNTETASQQHGYLAMQFTRSLQSLGDDYGYIFDTQAADVDMVDIVLNRRILVVLVPALEKSGDEVANLGKIVSASIKGMMGSALGSTVEGSSETVIENKPTHSSTPFMTVFDEVGYYVAEGMAVMAAQARSLGFSLVFAGQDLPALKKRVREEANSITANCNIKLFGKLEDPTETKDFFEKTVGSAMVTEVSGFQVAGGSGTNYHDSKQASVQLRPRASYDALRGFKEGQAIVTYGETIVDCAVFYSNPGHAKAMRVTRYMVLPPPDETVIKHANAITKLRDLMVNKTWTATRADVAVETSAELAALADGFSKNLKPKIDPIDAGIAALVSLHALDGEIPAATTTSQSSSSGGGQKVGPTITTPAAPVTPPAQPPASPLAVKPQAQSDTATQAPAQTQQQQAAPAKPTQPSIFGGAKPAEASAPAPSQAASEPATTAEQSTKPAIFGAAKPVMEQKNEEPVQTAEIAVAPVSPVQTPTEQNMPAKPAIFSAAKPVETPQALTPEAAPAPAQETASQPQASSSAEAVPAKPAIFSAAPKPAEKPAEPQQVEPVQSENIAPVVPAPVQDQVAPQVAKPAIFSIAKPVTKEKQIEPTPAAPKEIPPQVQSEQAQAAKPAIFSAAPKEAIEPAAEASTQPAKPAIFSAPKAPVEDTHSQPQQQAPIELAATPQASVPAEQPPQKPAIFGVAKPQEQQPVQHPQAQDVPAAPQEQERTPEEAPKDVPNKPAIFQKKTPPDEGEGQ